MKEKTCVCAADAVGKDDIIELLNGLRKGSVSLMPALRLIQGRYGYLPAEALSAAADYLRLPLSRVYSVATFYDELHLQPRGRHTIKVCRGSACSVQGGQDVVRAVKKTLKVEDGQTTPDFRFTFETGACFGNCAVAPVVAVDKIIYGDVTPEKLGRLINDRQRSEQEE